MKQPVSTDEVALVARRTVLVGHTRRPFRAGVSLYQRGRILDKIIQPPAADTTGATILCLGRAALPSRRIARIGVVTRADMIQYPKLLCPRIGMFMNHDHDRWPSVSLSLVGAVHDPDGRHQHGDHLIVVPRRYRPGDEDDSLPDVSFQ